MVRRGDFLAQIDPRPYQALLDQARGTLAHDQGLLAQARTDARRYALLQRQDSIGRQQAEDQQFVVQQYEGSVAADQGAIQTQLVNLAFCRITSPIDGRVGLRQVDAGNYVTPALANGLVVVTQLDPISAIFTLPEDDVPAIQAQIAAGATLSVAAYDRSNATLLSTGTLETLDNQIDTTTGTVKLRALFANPKLALFPNQFVNLRLTVSTVHGALTVPNAAVQTGAPGSFARSKSTWSSPTAQWRYAWSSPAWWMRKRRRSSTAWRWAGPRGDRRCGSPEGRREGDAAGQHSPWGAPGRCRAGRCRHTAPPPPQAATPRPSMGPSALFILRPVATTLLMVAILLLVGLIAYQLPAALRPARGGLPHHPDLRRFYPGASPEVMTSSVTAPLEKQFGQMPGLNQMSQHSSAGAS